MRDLEAPHHGNVIARTTAGPAETEAVGESMGKRAAAGDVILLIGDLGAGKTTFVRGFARGLGVAFGVKSPSFAIHLRYPGRLPLHHLDLYRVHGAKDLAELGLEDLLEREGVVIVEWGERLGDLVPRGALRIRLEEPGDAQRRLVVEGPEATIRRLCQGPEWSHP